MSGLISVSNVYNRFAALSALAERVFGGSLGGRLLLAPDLQVEMQEVVLATAIAGAAVLVVEPDPALIREANHGRVIDFSVTTLGEAIRILKNEIRKQQPVSVCLDREQDAAFAEMVDRGLQPDIVAVAGNHEQNLWASPFLSRGAQPLVVGSGSMSEPELLMISWSVSEGASRWLPKLDAILTGRLRGDPRAQWLKSAPLYLDRQLRSERFVPLKPEEAEDFAAAIQSEVRSGAIASAVTLRVGDAVPVKIDS